MINYQKMKKFFLSFLILINSFYAKVHSEDYHYILNENKFKRAYSQAINIINDEDIIISKSPLGIIISFEIKKPELNFYNLTPDTKNKLNTIKNFLAKNKNAVIIEVRTDKNTFLKEESIKNWEISTIISNNIENYFLREMQFIQNENIFSIGYGEFSPLKNTSNNGGKLLNRVDIIVLLNDINGE